MIKKENEPMSAHTFLKIGGPARVYVEASSSDELVAAVEEATDQKMPWAILGGGSNVLIADAGFDGMLIHPTDTTYHLQPGGLSCSAGALTASVARAAADAGLIGFEWGVGVPGTIGGATYGNAGCFGGEMRDVVEHVEAYHVESRRRVTYTNAECRFGYRDSRFKHEHHVMLQTVLSLTQGSSKDARATIQKIMSTRKDTQPQGTFSAGCLFKNFEFQDEAEISKLREQIDIPSPMLEKKRIPAGWLIDQLGLKGTTIGKAQISPTHGNFLINLGGARAEDVIALASLIKMKTRDTYGIQLQDEVQLLGF